MAFSKSQRRNYRRKISRLCARSLKTWRKSKEASFICPVMTQKKSTCYAIAHVRQLEFHLKLHNKMPLDQHLSIQDFINLIPRDYLSDDGSLMVGTRRVLKILKEEGILLEKDCELTENLDDPIPEDRMSLPRHFLKKATLYELFPKGASEVSQKKFDLFHERLIETLKLGVVAVGLTVYPSYSKLKHKQIYYPSKKELAGTERYGHVMVCTGHNYDAGKNLYYELQESAGVKVCDKGFVRIYAHLLHEFTKMEV